MADTRFTILGMSGAGKTCYLLGLYYKMGSGLKGYTITTDDDTDVNLRDRYRKLCDVTLGRESRFPAGTDNVSKYEFDLNYGFKPIMSFDWVDYPGGLLDQKNSGSFEEYEGIKKSIQESSTLFICVDGSLLCGDDEDEKIDAVRDNCSNVINTFFSEYFKSNKKLPPTAIVVTKYDVCREDTDEEELCEIIQEAFSPFFIENEVEKFVTIIPVSIGLNIMDDDYAGKLKPLNIHLPIFMGIWFALSKKIQEYAEEKDKEEVTAENRVNKLINQRIEEESKWIFKDKNEIMSLTNKIKNAKEESANKSNQMQQILNAMQSNGDKLLRELEKIPYVYINGRESSFSEINK